MVLDLVITITLFNILNTLAVHVHIKQALIFDIYQIRKTSGISDYICDRGIQSKFGMKQSNAMILKPVNCMYQIEFHNVQLSHIILYRFYNNGLLLVLDRIQTYKCYSQLNNKKQVAQYFSIHDSCIQSVYIVHVNYIFGKTMKMMP